VAANTVDFELVTAWRRDFSWVYASAHLPPIFGRISLLLLPLSAKSLGSPGLFGRIWSERSQKRL